MPYAQRDPWTMAMRRFLAQASISDDSEAKYRQWLSRTGAILGNPRPSTVTMPQLRQLERELPGGPSSKATLLTVTRMFLVYCRCKAASEWRFPYRIQPAANGVFLDELEVAQIRQVAARHDPLTRLCYSLAVDNGLRVIDMRRLTMDNARELLATRRTTIIGKGRGGGKPGPLELSRMTEKPLRDWLEARAQDAQQAAQDSPYLLAHGRNGQMMPYSYDLIRRKLNALSEASGIRFRPHDLRRTYGHRLHVLGIPIETIARLLRHETIDQSFRCYIGIQSDELRDAQDRLCRGTCP